MNKLNIDGDVFKGGDYNKPIRALPSSWYTNLEMYGLEKRAIFSKKWMLITHSNRLAQGGDWLKFDTAGFEFIVCRDRRGVINAFHNVCRHRAFPVVQGGDQGNALIFSCKYHGWSYGLSGNLAKAPKYEKLEDFDKSQNGLFKIHLKVDAFGFIWVNLDSSEEPEPWSEGFFGTDQQDRFIDVQFDNYIFDHQYQIDGEYNWKILADNFNECYHCPVAHPDLPTLADLGNLTISTDKDFIKHGSVPTDEQKEQGLGIGSTYFYPNASVVVLRHFMMIQRFTPTGPTTSSMQYQIFRNTTSSREEFLSAADMYKRIVAEDKALCEGSQKNLNAGVFVNGQLHPKLEHGPLFFQKVHREAIKAHIRLEQEAKKRIWPAQQKLPLAAIVSREDAALCSDLACGNQEDLAW